MEEITYYDVSQTEKEDAFIFQNPKIPTDTSIFKFEDIIIGRNDSDEKTLVFYLPGVPRDLFCTVVFMRSSQATRFIDFKVIERIIIS